MTGYIRGAMKGVNGNLAPKLHKRRPLAFLTPIQAQVDGGASWPDPCGIPWRSIIRRGALRKT